MVASYFQFDCSHNVNILFLFLTVLLKQFVLPCNTMHMRLCLGSGRKGGGGGSAVFTQCVSGFF